MVQAFDYNSVTDFHPFESSFGEPLGPPITIENKVESISTHQLHTQTPIQLLPQDTKQPQQHLQMPMQLLPEEPKLPQQLPNNMYIPQHIDKVNEEPNLNFIKDNVEKSIESKIPSNNHSIKSENIALSLALLISTITVGATLDTMQCDWIKFIKSNILAKFGLIFLTIYFSISFSKTSKNNVEPIYMIKTSFIVLLFYILFSRMNITFSNIVVTSFFFLLIYRDSVKYSNDLDDLDHYTELENNIQYFVKIIGLLIITGFWYHYHNERQRIGSQKFSNYDFLFKNKCQIDI